MRHVRNNKIVMKKKLRGKCDKKDKMKRENKGSIEVKR